MTYARSEDHQLAGEHGDRLARAIRLFLPTFLSQRFVAAHRSPDEAQRSKRVTVSFVEDFNLT